MTCPNEANHTPHPTTHVAHSCWAADAMCVADQHQCAGCGRFAIWTPKRRDLRIAPDWPLSSCDWGGCWEQSVGERYSPEAGEWLPVCKQHTGVKERRPSAGRGVCSECGKEYALSADGVVRAHDAAFAVRCPGGRRAPRAGESR